MSVGHGLGIAICSVVCHGGCSSSKRLLAVLKMQVSEIEVSKPCIEQVRSCAALKHFIFIFSLCSQTCHTTSLLVLSRGTCPSCSGSEVISCFRFPFMPLKMMWVVNGTVRHATGYHDSCMEKAFRANHVVSVAFPCISSRNAVWQLALSTISYVSNDSRSMASMCLYLAKICSPMAQYS